MPLMQTPIIPIYYLPLYDLVSWIYATTCILPKTLSIWLENLSMPLTLMVWPTCDAFAGVEVRDLRFNARSTILARVASAFFNVLFANAAFIASCATAVTTETRPPIFACVRVCARASEIRLTSNWSNTVNTVITFVVSMTRFYCSVACVVSSTRVRVDTDGGRGHWWSRRHWWSRGHWCSCGRIIGHLTVNSSKSYQSQRTYELYSMVIDQWLIIIVYVVKCNNGERTENYIYIYIYIQYNI